MVARDIPYEIVVYPDAKSSYDVYLDFVNRANISIPTPRGKKICKDELIELTKTFMNTKRVFYATVTGDDSQNLANADISLINAELILCFGSKN